MKLIETIRKLQQGEEIILVALGDSLTSGWLEEKGYADFVGQWIRETFPEAGLTLINRGIPGDTAAGGLGRLKTDVLDFQPDLVFVQFGLNDAYVGISVENFSNTTQSIVQKIHQCTKAEVLLITSVPLLWNPSDNEIMERYYQTISEGGRKHGVAVAKVHDYWKERISQGVDFSSLVHADGIHPTEAGYRLMAEAVWHAFQ